MRSPEEVRGLLGTRYRRNLVTWLAEGEPGRDTAGRHEPKPGKAGRDTSGRDEPGGDGPVGSASDSVVPRPGSAERGQWPVSLPLHPPTGRQVLADPAEVAHWIRTWAQADSPRLPWRVRWEERHWRGYGRQSVPVRVEVDDAPGVARLVRPSRSVRCPKMNTRKAGIIESTTPARTVATEPVPILP